MHPVLRKYLMWAIIAATILATIVFLFPAFLINQSAEVGDPETPLALGVIELVALTLPALAIFLQVVLRYTEDLPEDNDPWEDTVLERRLFEERIFTRTTIFVLATFIILMLFLAVLTLHHYFILPAPLDWAIFFVTFALLGFLGIAVILTRLSMIKEWK